MEMVVAIAIFSVLSISIYQGYAQIFKTTNFLKTKTVATNLANEQIEIIRNLPYDNVGTIGGIPSGVVDPSQEITREGIDFVVLTTIRNIDLPFDGTLGGSPDDLSPADNKLVEIEIQCALCQNFSNLVFNTNVAPQSLESLSTNGALRINVFDANGEDISGANVSIVNSGISPNIDIDDVTGNNGILTIVDAPPSFESYELLVTKGGYSMDQTYISDISNPNPIKPHVTVSQGQITDVSFIIDETSTMNISSVTDTCQAVSAFDFDLVSSKLIGTNPDVLKYDSNHSTNGSGLLSLSDMEWGTYTVNTTDSSYDVAGFNPFNPLTITPGVDQDLKITLFPKDSPTTLFTIKAQGTGDPISNAVVSLQKTGFNKTFLSGQSAKTQTDWSGGQGQVNYSDPTVYSSDDGGINVNNPIGSILLFEDIDGYVSSGELISSTFDLGPGVTYHDLSWSGDIPISTDIQVQIATTSSGTPTDFIGPDGTSSTFFTSIPTDIPAISDGDRYFRYKVSLSTSNPLFTPTFDNLEFNFSGNCVAPGQIAFQGLSNGTYTLTVNADGYQEFSQDIDLNNAWQEVLVEMDE